MYALDLPHIEHLFFCLGENLGSLFAFSTMHVLAIFPPKIRAACRVPRAACFSRRTLVRRSLGAGGSHVARHTNIYFLTYFFLNGMPRCSKSTMASSLFFADVTKVISMPRVLTTLSKFTSGNIICSFIPSV